MPRNPKFLKTAFLALSETDFRIVQTQSLSPLVSFRLLRPTRLPIPPPKTKIVPLRALGGIWGVSTPLRGDNCPIGDLFTP
jgi:hypothetical protein